MLIFSFGSPLNKVVIYLLAELFTALKGNDSKCPHWYGFKVAFFLKHDIFLRRCVVIKVSSNECRHHIF